jgi:transposase
MKPTSLDLRQRIVTARQLDSLAMGQIAERYRIPRGTVQNILERYRDDGTIGPRPANARLHAAFQGKALHRLEDDVLHHPDVTLAELRERSGVSAFIVAVHNALKRVGFTRKKKLRAGEQRRPDVLARRRG